MNFSANDSCEGGRVSVKSGRTYPSNNSEGTNGTAAVAIAEMCHYQSNFEAVSVLDRALKPPTLMTL